MKFRFVRENRGKYKLGKMCKLLGVSRSGYYKWLKRKASNRDIENRKLYFEIKMIYVENRKSYGSPRIFKELRSRGKKYNKKRIERIMRENGLQAKAGKKYKVTTRSKHNLVISKDLLNQDFKANRPNEKWVTDITYLRTQEGWLYLCAIMDLYSRKIVGWSMDQHLRSSIVCRALEQAIERQDPVEGLILHSDRGVQYASDEFRRLVSYYKIRQSMGRKGNCYDNAVIESFFHTLKVEQIYSENYHTREEAKRNIFYYIEVFYNRKRRHSSIGYHTPEEFETMFYKNVA